MLPGTLSLHITTIILPEKSRLKKSTLGRGKEGREPNKAE